MAKINGIYFQHREVWPSVERSTVEATPGAGSKNPIHILHRPGVGEFAWWRANFLRKLTQGEIQGPLVANSSIALTGGLGVISQETFLRN